MYKLSRYGWRPGNVLFPAEISQETVLPTTADFPLRTVDYPKCG
jgi:hypothetical protein